VKGTGFSPYISGLESAGLYRLCGKRLVLRETIPKSVPQGLKPIDFIAFIGTTEVVPFQNDAFFRSLFSP
jgi:hypothetical protein